MKSAVIIGATSGIGASLSELLLSEGYRVGLLGRRTERLEPFVKKYGQDKVVVAGCDVTKDGSEESVRGVIEAMGCPPDLFVYVSGVGFQNRSLDMQKELVTVRTNCEGMVRMLDWFIGYVRTCPHYSKSCPAHIAVVSSVAGTKGLGTAPAYSATKKMQSTYISALCQLSRMEKIPVVFSDIRPGFVKTDILNPDKHYPMAISSEKAAQHIFRGLKARRRIIIFDWRFKLIVLLWNLIPRCIWERLAFVKN